MSAARPRGAGPADSRQLRVHAAVPHRISKFGIDPVHFGMIMILNPGIGFITPPVGLTLLMR